MAAKRFKIICGCKKDAEKELNKLSNTYSLTIEAISTIPGVNGSARIVIVVSW